MSDVQKLQDLIDTKFKGSKAAFSRAIDRAPTQVGSYLKGRREIGIAFKAHVEKVLDIPGWFGVMSQPAKTVALLPYVGDAQGTYALQNVTPIAPRQKVPLLSWDTVGAWTDEGTMYLSGDVEKWLPVWKSEPSPRAFALEVQGEMMVSQVPGDKITFPAGTVIVVDPTIPAKSGDFVVARDMQSGQPTFKKLSYDAGRWLLRPLHPGFPTVEIDDPQRRVIGKVIEFIWGGSL